MSIQEWHKAVAKSERLEAEHERLLQSWIDAKSCIREIRAHVQEQRNISGFVQYSCSPIRIWQILEAYDQRHHDAEEKPHADA